MTRSFVDPKLKVLEDNLTRKKLLRIIDLNYYPLDERKLDEVEENALIDFWIYQRGDHLAYFESVGNWLMCGYVYQAICGPRRLYGPHSKKMYTRAFECFKKAELNGSVQAIVEIGKCYLEVKGVPTCDMDIAFKCFQDAKSKGSTQAIVKLGFCYYYGSGVPTNKEKAMEWYLDAESKGSIHAMTRLGTCYLYGDGVDKSYERALSYFYKAESKGSVEAIWEIGC